jgi:CheY-like chemotaxis protein
MNHIFIAEDNYADAVLLREALRENGVDASYDLVEDGGLVLKRLHDLADTHHLPDLIILDINLPHVQGIELLSSIRADPLLTQVHTVMVTGSSSPRDRERCRSADAYVLKGGNWDDSMRLARYLTSFLPEATAPAVKG